ncbi:MAG: hypothetical protein JSR66_10105 [Proteobacteria bacterium]|nr:hypothetical protein [Pseudomonadota bacterium]
MSEKTAINFGRALLAGLIATVVLSVLMVLKQMMHLMPELNPISMMSNMMGAPLLVGWVAHFMIGTLLWGLLYAGLQRLLPGPGWIRGALFATGAWLVMMIALMPMAGAGLFGLNLGMMAPIATLMLHWIYGAVSGAVYEGSEHEHAGHRHAPAD